MSASTERDRAEPTVLDVIENAIGSRPSESELEKLTVAEMDDLRGFLEELWAAQAAHSAAGAALIGGWMGPHWSEPTMRQELGEALLFYPRLLVLDPLADFFSSGAGLPEPWTVRYRRADGQHNVVSAGPKIWRESGPHSSLRGDRAHAAMRLNRIVQNLYELEEPLRGGVVILRSQWPTIARNARRLETSVRLDVRSTAMQRLFNSTDGPELQVWDTLHGFGVTADVPPVPADEQWRAAPAFYYLAKTLAVADAADAQYVPSSRAALNLLRQKFNDTKIAHRHPAEFLREVARVVVPSVDTSIKEAVAIRRSSADFEDWRSGLRTLQRSTHGDAEDLREHVEDYLNPLSRAVRRDLERSSVRASMRPDGADIVIDATVAGTVAAATAPVLGAGAAAGIAAGQVVVSGAARWLRRAYAQPQGGGANAVLATLLRGSKR